MREKQKDQNRRDAIKGAEPNACVPWQNLLCKETHSKTVLTLIIAVPQS